MMNIYNMKSAKMIMADSATAVDGNQIWQWSVNGAATNMATFIHSDKNTIGWSDGHVETMDAKAVRAALDADDYNNEFKYYISGKAETLAAN
jgi:prepilin-type processing-associated H-X9-DG protein